MVPVALNVGFDNYVISDKVIALVSSDSAPMRRVIQEFRKSGRLIDATQGRKTKSVVFLESGQIAASALPQEILTRRISGDKNASAVQPVEDSPIDASGE
jgi:regulator of extracellular matrix RemA (YlzA/DUF370 family)